MSMLSKLKNFVIGGPQRSNVHVGAQPKHIGQPDNYTPGILTFHQSKLEVPAAAKKGCKWWTATKGCGTEANNNNDWSIQIVFKEDPVYDSNGESTARVDIRFLVPQAEYLLKPGTVFTVGAEMQRKISIEVE